MWTSIANVLEVIGGSRPFPETWKGRTDVAFLRAGWWIVLLLLALAFAGRNIKFVYVDF
ncbi:MAG: hypothetical protein ACRELY_13930 [Polyangiaceae bacterium]